MGDIIDLETHRRRRAERQRRRTAAQSESPGRRSGRGENGEPPDGGSDGDDAGRDRDPERTPSS